MQPADPQQMTLDMSERIFKAITFPPLFASLGREQPASTAWFHQWAEVPSEEPWLPDGDYLQLARGGFVQCVSHTDAWRPTLNDIDVLGFHVMFPPDEVVKPDDTVNAIVSMIDYEAAKRLAGLLSFGDYLIQGRLISARSGLMSHEYTEEDGSWHYLGSIDLFLAAQVSSE